MSLVSHVVSLLFCVVYSDSLHFAHRVVKVESCRERYVQRPEKVLPLFIFIQSGVRSPKLDSENVAGGMLACMLQRTVCGLKRPL